MSILDRKPKKYSTSDLFWEPNAAPSDGAVGDINTMRVSPDHLGMVQDMIVDSNGVLRSRGTIASVTSDSFTTVCLLGGIQSLAGTALFANDFTSGGASSYIYGTSAATLTGFAKLTASGNSAVNSVQELTAAQGPIFNSVRLPGDVGALVAAQQGSWANQGGCSSWLWGGNAVTTSDTTAGTAASTAGSTAVVGVGTAWTSALNNCYLFIGAGAAARYIGQVKSVVSTTSLTLYKGSFWTIAAAAPAFKTMRTIQNMPYKGRITTTVASTTVVGANTKFQSGGPTGLSMFSVGAVLYRASDGALIGTSASVQNDTTLTLGANAAIAMTNEEYYCMPAGAGQLVNTWPIWGVAASAVEYFANRFWYGGIIAGDAFGGAIMNPFNFGVAGTLTSGLSGFNSLAFSKKDVPDQLDLDPSAGDIINLPYGQKPDFVRALCATRGGLVVFRALDTFLITGYSPETFRAIKISDDGAFGCHSYKPYNEGVIWAGQKSVYYFDGTKVVDVLQNKVRRFYQRTARVALNGGSPGMAISNDHVLVSYGMFGGNIDGTWPYKNTTKNMTYCTMVINMVNGAVSFFTNLYVTTHISPRPTSSSAPYQSILLTRQSSANNSGSWLVGGNAIFEDAVTGSLNFDSILGCGTFLNVQQIGPDWMFETTKLSLGNAARLKFWKMLMMNYSSDVSVTATIIGTNDTSVDFPNRSTGTVAITTFPVSSNVGILKRIKFLVRSPQLVIRVYPTATTSATSQRFKLFWYAVGGKWMRWGRAQ